VVFYLSRLLVVTSYLPRASLALASFFIVLVPLVPLASFFIVLIPLVTLASFFIVLVPLVPLHFHLFPYTLVCYRRL
jgi:hypothetical protein